MKDIYLAVNSSEKKGILAPVPLVVQARFMVDRSGVKIRFGIGSWYWSTSYTSHSYYLRMEHIIGTKPGTITSYHGTIVLLGIECFKTLIPPF